MLWGTKLPHILPETSEAGAESFASQFSLSLVAMGGFHDSDVSTVSSSASAAYTSGQVSQSPDVYFPLSHRQLRT